MGPGQREGENRMKDAQWPPVSFCPVCCPGHLQMEEQIRRLSLRQQDASLFVSSASLSWCGELAASTFDGACNRMETRWCSFLRKLSHQHLNEDERQLLKEHLQTYRNSGDLKQFAVNVRHLLFPEHAVEAQAFLFVLGNMLPVTMYSHFYSLVLKESPNNSDDTLLKPQVSPPKPTSQNRSAFKAGKPMAKSVSNVLGETKHSMENELPLPVSAKIRYHSTSFADEPTVNDEKSSSSANQNPLVRKISAPSSTVRRRGRSAALRRIQSRYHHFHHHIFHNPSEAAMLSKEQYTPDSTLPMSTSLGSILQSTPDETVTLGRRFTQQHPVTTQTWDEERKPFRSIPSLNTLSEGHDSTGSFHGLHDQFLPWVMLPANSTMDVATETEGEYQTSRASSQGRSSRVNGNECVRYVQNLAATGATTSAFVPRQCSAFTHIDGSYGTDTFPVIQDPPPVFGGSSKVVTLDPLIRRDTPRGSVFQHQKLPSTNKASTVPPRQVLVSHSIQTDPLFLSQATQTIPIRTLEGACQMLPSSKTDGQGAENQNKTGLKLKVNRWHAVATWKWLANEVHCGICRMPFEACCSKCHSPGDDCPLVWGTCQHCFHMHCIIDWQQQCESNRQEASCPICRVPWKFKE